MHILHVYTGTDGIRMQKADGPHNGRVEETDTFTETMAKCQLHTYAQAYHTKLMYAVDLNACIKF